MKTCSEHPYIYYFSSSFWEFEKDVPFNCQHKQTNWAIITQIRYMCMHKTTEKKGVKFYTSNYYYWLANIFYLESNFGRHMGVQLSDSLNDSEELTKLNIRWRSAGWM